MSWGVYGILVVFGLFIILLIFKPNLSCFGKKLKSPFYPIFGKKKARRARQRKGEDYGFHLTEEEKGQASGPSGKTQKKTDDYGFRLD